MRPLYLILGNRLVSTVWLQVCTWYKTMVKGSLLSILLLISGGLCAGGKPVVDYSVRYMGINLTSGDVRSCYLMGGWERVALSRYFVTGNRMWGC